MSQLAEHKTKKRKHAEPLEPPAPAAKKSKKDKAKKDKKGKARAAASEFAVVRTALTVSIPPVFAGDPRAGVEEMLDSMLMRRAALRPADCPFAVCPVEFDATVWNPRVGMKLSARINLSSPDHVSLLVHRTFNVSIPRHHIPTDSWQFEYGPAENDPEYAADAGGENAEGDHIADTGKWMHSTTGEQLGGENGKLEFTVVGLTVANQMLSLIGSIQPDPFSPEHIPEATNTVVSPGKHHAQPVTHHPDDESESEEEREEDEEDAAQAEERARQEAAAAKAAKREKKRQRKEDAAQTGSKKKRTS